MTCRRAVRPPPRSLGLCGYSTAITAARRRHRRDLRLHRILALIAAAAGAGLVIVGLILSLSKDASAAPPACAADRDSALAKLSKEYGESRRAYGVAPGGLLVEIFASPEGTFSIVVTGPDRSGQVVSCMAFYGDDFTVTEQPRRGSGT